jgi:hypothetical protein
MDNPEMSGNIRHTSHGTMTSKQTKNTKRQLRMDNPEMSATLDTHHTGR